MKHQQTNPNPTTHHQQKQQKSCTTLLSTYLQTNKKIKSKLKNLKHPPNIKCGVCDVHARGYFSASSSKAKKTDIILCSNVIKNREDFETTLLHELTHASDHLTQKYNLSSCEGLASSEIQAAKAAECREGCYLFSKVCIFGNVCDYFRKRCVKSYALNSTVKVFPKKGKSCIEKVFHKCYYNNE